MVFHSAVNILETGPDVTMMVNWSIDDGHLCALGERIKEGKTHSGCGWYHSMDWALRLDTQGGRK